MNNIFFIFIIIYIGLSVGLAASIFADKSYVKVSDGETLPTKWRFFYIVLGGIFGFLAALLVTLKCSATVVWIATAALALLTLFQIINPEGKSLMASWNTYALFAVLVLVFSLAKYKDEQGIQVGAGNIGFDWFFLIPILAPFVIGGIKTAMIERGVEFKRPNRSGGNFTKNLVGVTVVAVLAIALVGVIGWSVS